MEHDYAKEGVRKIDGWINHIVHHAWVRTIVFFIALLEATISPLLPEIVVAAILSYRKDISWKLLSVVSALGSVTGVTLLYFGGKYLYTSYQSFFDRLLNVESVGYYTDLLLGQNTFIAMVLASFTPVPDRVVALLSGILSLSFFIVLVGFFIGRLVRVGIVAYFSYHYGDEARSYIVKHTKRVTVVVLGLIFLYALYRYIS